jgi:hypothetical protein
MGCNCKKKEPVVILPKQIVERQPTEEEIKLIDDFYNNIDEIEPIIKDGKKDS